MPTRMFASQAAAPVAPVANGSWDNTPGTPNLKLSRTKLNLAFADFNMSWGGPSGRTAIGRRFVSDPLRGNQAISGTVKAQCLARELNLGQDIFTRAEIYVVNNAGSSVRGTLLSGPTLYGPNTELNDSNRNKTFMSSGTALTNVNALSGDRIVVNLGFTKNVSGVVDAWLRLGSLLANGDLPENETSTSDQAAWIEFSQNLLFSDVFDVSGQGRNAIPSGAPVYRDGVIRTRRRV